MLDAAAPSELLSAQVLLASVSRVLLAYVSHVSELLSAQVLLASVLCHTSICPMCRTSICVLMSELLSAQVLLASVLRVLLAYVSYVSY
jgi:hypothetical protein